MTAKPNHSLPLSAALAALMAALFLAAGCGDRNPAEADAGKHFGEPFTGAETVAIGRLLEAPDAFNRRPVRVAGQIERQCPASGCWLVLRDSQGNSLRVELGDTLPKLPKNIGNAAEVEGELIRHGANLVFIGTRVTFRKTPGDVQ